VTGDQFDEALELICRVLCDAREIDPDERASGLPVWHSQLGEARRIMQGLQALGGVTVPRSRRNALTLH
jgi:hypothetical protein